MTTREWRASHCLECHGTDPDEGWHERCGCHEIPTATAISAGQDASMGVRKTAPGGASTPLVQGPRPSEATGGLQA